MGDRERKKNSSLGLIAARIHTEVYMLTSVFIAFLSAPCVCRGRYLSAAHTNTHTIL